MERGLELRLYLDDSAKSDELASYMDELARLTDKIQVVRVQAEEAAAEDERPCVRVFCGGKPVGIAFHGVPGGHEFTSFVLGLYNAAGPGQALDESLRQRLLDWDAPCHLRIFVSLSCTLCPELVTAAQRLATLNPRITTDVYDLNLYPSLREAYQVMSVPCFLINEDGPHFGKKTAAQLPAVPETGSLFCIQLKVMIFPPLAS